MAAAALANTLPSAALTVIALLSMAAIVFPIRKASTLVLGIQGHDRAFWKSDVIAVLQASGVNMVLQGTALQS
ncbi:hypothetical protein ACFQX9_16720 [Bradyrhizobium sp. GCM10028915]|uniref:hypothetical protein n=1 Tax=Bradyrhizobium sp. GCM10028915 TaxID=3273385 RepID=UPI003610BB7E